MITFEKQKGQPPYWLRESTEQEHEAHKNLVRKMEELRKTYQRGRNNRDDGEKRD